MTSSGRVRISVSPVKVQVEYVRSYLQQDVNAQQVNNATVYSYEMLGH
jgi:hypothetical protein